MERLRYVGRIGTLARMGTIATVGTILLTVRVGTVGKVNRIGTMDEVTYIGTLNRVSGGRIGTLGRLGTLHYSERVGTVQRLGTLSYVGTIGRVVYQPRLGTIAHAGTMGYLGTVSKISRIGTAHTGTVPVEIARRQFIGTVTRDRVRLGPGSTWTGSWFHIGSYRTKTVKFNIGNPGTSGGGSIAIVMGLAGTRQADITGTYYGPARVGKGSVTVITWTEAMRYVRPWVRQHAALGSYWGGGTVSFGIGLHV